MKFEVGKKYRIEGSDKPWEVVAVDKRGTAWGLLNGVMAYQNFIEIIGEWHDKPDPGEGWRLLHPDEDVEEGDECYLKFGGTFADWEKVNCSNNKQTPGMFYRRRTTPQYVPYTWDDREELRGRWYRRNNEKQNERQVTAFKVCEYNLFINGWTAERFLKDYVWLDGSPCGKRVV